MAFVTMTWLGAFRYRLYTASNNDLFTAIYKRQTIVFCYFDALSEIGRHEICTTSLDLGGSPPSSAFTNSKYAFVDGFSFANMILPVFFSIENTLNQHITLNESDCHHMVFGDFVYYIILG